MVQSTWLFRVLQKACTASGKGLKKGPSPNQGFSHAKAGFQSIQQARAGAGSFEVLMVCSNAAGITIDIPLADSSLN